MGRILLVRHGETVANRDRIIQGPRIDAELSALGLRQAESLAAALANEPLGVVYSSPMARARQTATAVVRGHTVTGLPVQVVPELYEMDYGDFAGRRYDDVEGEMEQVLDAWKMGFTDQSFPGGESAILAQHRIRPFAQRLRDQARAATVAVVAHGRINRVLIATLTGAGLTRLEDFPQANASITELAVNGDVRVERLNDTAHLDMATDAFS
ncbi:MAG: histidine phosphatase family protein [bacterium]